jgi:hypothetical protein
MSAQWYGSSCLNPVCCSTALLNKQGIDCLVAVAAMCTDISIVAAGGMLVLGSTNSALGHWLGAWLVTPTLLRRIPLDLQSSWTFECWLAPESSTAHGTPAYVAACITHWRMLSQ